MAGANQAFAEQLSITARETMLDPRFLQSLEISSQPQYLQSNIKSDSRHLTPTVNLPVVQASIGVNYNLGSICRVSYAEIRTGRVSADDKGLSANVASVITSWSETDLITRSLQGTSRELISRRSSDATHRLTWKDEKDFQRLAVAGQIGGLRRMYSLYKDMIEQKWPQETQEDRSRAKSRADFEAVKAFISHVGVGSVIARSLAPVTLDSDSLDDFVKVSVRYNFSEGQISSASIDFTTTFGARYSQKSIGDDVLCEVTRIGDAQLIQGVLHRTFEDLPAHGVVNRSIVQNHAERFLQTAHGLIGEIA